MAQFILKRHWIGVLLLCAWSAPVFAAGVSDEELKAIGIKAQDAIRSGKVDAFGGLWNSRETADRITQNIAAPADVKDGFLKGIGDNMGATLGAALAKMVAENGSYTYLGIKTVDGQRRPILRLLSDQGLNFHELIIEAGADGKPHIVDMYIVISGESLVQTERRMYLMLANKDKRDPNVDAMFKLGENFRRGDFQGVLDVYDAAPEKLKHDRVVSIYRLTAAQRLGKEEIYYAALADYAKINKEDAAVELLSIDVLFKKKDFTGMMKALDSLEKKMGPDGAIDFYRANLKSVAGDAKAALDYATKAVEKDPSLFDAVDFCLTTALQNGDFVLSKKYLLAIENHHSRFRFGDLKNVEMFKEFVKSPQYGEWLKERPVK